MNKFHVRPGDKSTEYKNVLMCDDIDKTGPVGLFSVVVTSPMTGTSTHFVLAPDAEAAESMARCVMGVASYEVGKEIYDAVGTKVARLPLVILGWGKATF